MTGNVFYDEFISKPVSLYICFLETTAEDNGIGGIYLFLFFLLQ